MKAKLTAFARAAWHSIKEAALILCVALVFLACGLIKTADWPITSTILFFVGVLALCALADIRAEKARNDGMWKVLQFLSSGRDCNIEINHTVEDKRTTQSAKVEAA